MWKREAKSLPGMGAVSELLPRGRRTRPELCCSAEEAPHGLTVHTGRLGCYALRRYRIKKTSPSAVLELASLAVRASLAPEFPRELVN